MIDHVPLYLYDVIKRTNNRLEFKNFSTEFTCEQTLTANPWGQILSSIGFQKLQQNIGIFLKVLWLLAH